MGYIEELKKEFETKFPEGGVRDIICSAMAELDVKGGEAEIKLFVRTKMEEVNQWWIKMSTEHLKYCTPAGRKVITRLQGKKNRNLGATANAN